MRGYALTKLQVLDHAGTCNQAESAVPYRCGADRNRLHTLDEYTRTGGVPQ